jgi:adenosine deaminase
LFDKYIYALVNSEEAVRFATRAVLNAFLEDGVAYLELRTTPRAVLEAGMTRREYVVTVLDCMARFKEESEGRMPTYLILSIDRSKHSASDALEIVSLACEMRGRGVVGVDLCGNPAKGNVSIFKDAFAKAREEGLHITLHFAEIPASSRVEELEMLLSFRPERLGHVVHVPENIVAEIIKRGIALELCLSCNVKAKLTEGGYEGHHFGFWRGQTCPVVLCVST